MYTKDSIEAAFCFFHQKQRIYTYSTIDKQKDEIEFAISSYVEAMNKDLYNEIANGKNDFLTDHKTFAKDMWHAVERLEQLLNK